MTSRKVDGYSHEYGEKCKYCHIEVQQGGGWLEICEVTGGRVIGSDEGFDKCPFMEVSDEKQRQID